MLDVKKKETLGARVFGVFNTVFMILLIVITLYPYLNQLAISFNDAQDTSFGGVTLFPRVFTLFNYETVFANKLFNQAAFNSVLRVVSGTAISLVITTCAAYALARKKFRGKNFIITLLLIPTFISGGLIPQFMLYRELGLMNNFLVYILPGSFNFFNMIIIRTFFQTIPYSLEESAIIDGAGEITILTRIMLPLSMPVMATVGLWVAVYHWNDWLSSLYFTTKSNLSTLQFILYKVVKEAELINEMASQQARIGGAMLRMKVTPSSVRAATIIIATLPIVLLYPFLQKYFIKGVIVGAVKE